MYTVNSSLFKFVINKSQIPYVVLSLLHIYKIKLHKQLSYLIIKTHDSESRGQEAAIICETKITRPLSELFTRKTTKKIANALAKLL